MYVIAIVTGATIMLSLLKLTNSCVVYTIVNVCNCYCYRCNHNVTGAGIICVIAIAIGAPIMLPMLKLTDSCVVYTFVHVCNCGCYRYNHNIATAKVIQLMCRVHIRTCM